MSDTKDNNTPATPAVITPSKYQRLSLVEVPPEQTRFSTNIAGLDACLAESDDGPQGLPAGTSILLSGMPGGGKSTIATYMAAMQTGRESVIFHGEERAERVKERWTRLGLKDADPYVIPLKNGEEALEAVRDLNTMPGGKGVGHAVLDSIQTAWWGGKRKYDHQYEFAEAFVGQVVSSGGCATLVSHVSKNGNDHAGAAALSHLVDIWIHLTANAKKAERLLEIRKNRMGRAGFQVPLNILVNGLSVGVPAPLNMTGGHALARNNLERARDVAIEMLLKGERVDGYSFLAIDPALGISNGNMWRPGLEMAAHALMKDGHVVLCEKVNGRKGYRLESPPAQTPTGDVVIVTKKMAVDPATNKAVELPEGQTAVAPPTPGKPIVAHGDDPGMGSLLELD